MPPVPEELFLEAVHLAYIVPHVRRTDLAVLRGMLSLCLLMDWVQACMFVHYYLEQDRN